MEEESKQEIGRKLQPMARPATLINGRYINKDNIDFI